MSDYSRRNTNNSTTSPVGNRSRGSRGRARRKDIPEEQKTKLKIISKKGPVSLFADSNSPTIEAMCELETNGYINKFGPGLDLADKCEETLNAIGFTMVEVEELSPGLEQNLKNFSLIGSTNIDESINNSRITDPDLNKLTPVKHSAEEKFKEEADSFYDLDQERPEQVKRITKKEQLRSRKKRTTIKVASRMVPVVKKSHNKILDKKSKRSIKR